MRRRLYLWIGVLVLAVSGFYTYYVFERHRCVGRSDVEIAGVARNGLIDEPSEEKVRGILESKVSPQEGKKARVVQFVTWAKDKTYDVTFSVPGAKGYWDVRVSDTCGIHVERIDELYKPL